MVDAGGFKVVDGFGRIRGARALNVDQQQAVACGSGQCLELLSAGGRFIADAADDDVIGAREVGLDPRPPSQQFGPSKPR